MRIYMQMPPTDETAPRFFHLHLQEDLIEGWTLVKESGHQGSPGRMRKEHYARRDEAEAALMKARDSQLRRGYRVVFAEGDTP